MSDYNMDVVPGLRAPVLSTALLLHVQRLNRDYVEVLLAERTRPGPAIAVETLSDKLVHALAQLNAPARTALASCPFALYSLGFDDQRFWNAALAERPGLSGESAEARYGPASTAPTQAAFCEVALFAAWHTACAHRMAARFLFGMPEHVAGRLVAAPLWQVRRIALDHPGLLTPRWPGNPAFWPDLVKFAAANDMVKLEAARLLGSQLIAAEFDGSARRAGRQRARLQTRKRK